MFLRSIEFAFILTETRGDGFGMNYEKNFQVSCRCRQQNSEKWLRKEMFRPPLNVSVISQEDGKHTRSSTFNVYRY